MDVGMARLRSQWGLLTKVERSLGKATHRTWTQIPLRHVFKVAKISGFPPEALRPDHFLDDPLRAEAARRYLTEPVPPRIKQCHVPKLRPLNVPEHRAVWLDKKTYLSNKAAIAAIKKLRGIGTSPTSCMRLWGPSGRPHGGPKGHRKQNTHRVCHSTRSKIATQSSKVQTNKVTAAIAAASAQR